MSSKNNVGMIDTKDMSIQEWVIIIVIDDCEKHDIMMLSDVSNEFTMLLGSAWLRLVLLASCVKELGHIR